MVVCLSSKCEAKVGPRIVESRLMCYTSVSIYNDLKGLLLLPPCNPFFV